MTMRLEAFGGSPDVLGEVDPPRGPLCDEAAAALAALLGSLGFEKVTVVFEQPPVT